MAGQTQILNTINEYYPMNFDAIEFVRDSGCIAYTVYAHGCKYFYVLYEFVEGEEVNPEQDAEMIGAFVGKLHNTMKGYPGKLIKNDKYYYVDRYINIMRVKQYNKVNEFITYGNILWNRVKDLPYGNCHGDMYRGNILKTSD